MKNLILILLIVGGINFSLKSSHGVGGDIQFVQTGANSYDMNMRLFRYCEGTSAGLLSSYSVNILDQFTCATAMTVTAQRDSFAPINFGDECYTPPGLCVEVHYYSASITGLANNVNGYMATFSLCCRNTVLNVASNNLGLYTKFPDPAMLGGNSTPKFGDYPTDGYFCIGIEKEIDFSATDLDGDSLVYTLINPINNFSGCTPNLLAYNATFNLANILGPGSLCVINSATGIVTARPAQLGKFVISVRVDEYRNGVKHGETIRDIQYSSLNCNNNELPSYYDFEDIKVLKFDETHCFDVAAYDRDAEDTFFIDISSTAFDYGATVSLPSPNSSGLYDFNWFNPTTGLQDSIIGVDVRKLTATRFEGVGKIGVKFCWTIDDCDMLTVDTFDFKLYGYSLGCDGSIDSIEGTVKMVIEKPQSDFIVPNVFSPNGDGINDFYFLKKDAYDRCYDGLNVRIFNRWGQLVYESEDANFEWDGKDKNGADLSAGSYFVVLQGYYGGKEVTQNFPLTLFR